MKFDNKTKSRIGKTLLVIGLMTIVTPTFADQILSGAWSTMTDNFGSGAVVWGIFLFADLIISTMAYAGTKSPKVFFSTFILLAALKVFIGLIIAYVQTS